MTSGGFSFGGPPAGAGGGFRFSGGGGFDSVPNNNNFSFGSAGAGGTATAVADRATTMTTTTPNDNGPSIRALAWDPTGPASLSLAPAPSSSSSAGRTSDGGVDLDVFLSHDGTGCGPEEAECLLRCLDAREERTASVARGKGRRVAERGAAGGVAGASMDYRAALCECLVSLRNRGEARDGGDGADVGGSAEEEGNNLELLSLTYAISHLAEIFLLPSSSLSASKFGGGSRGGADDAAPSRLDGPAGSLTADAVRYLRHHHTGGSTMDSPAVRAMLESDQPEYYRFPSSGDDDIVHGGGGPYDRPYWNLLLRLVIRGELHDAWTLLSRCSACRRAEEEATRASAETEGERGADLGSEVEGFAALRALLLSAPIPGGRGDAYCDDAGIDDRLEEESLEREDEEWTSGRQRVRGHDDDNMEEEDGEDPGDADELMIDGVPPHAYLLWEALPRRACGLRALRYRRDLRSCGRARDADHVERDAPTMPEAYRPRAALNAFRNWQETVRVTAFPAGVVGGGGVGSDAGGVMSALFRRFPPLAQILSVLLGGVAPPAVANDMPSWSDRLLMELLYSRPDIAPDDIATRARLAMSDDDGGESHALRGIVLSVMGGGAGQVVETMFSLCGGASGAALPATMTSLLCDLLVDAGRISPRIDESKVDIQTELLLLAAESVLSSFSVQGQHALGTRTAVRLLLPNAPPRRRVPRPAGADMGADDEDDMLYEPRVSAVIAEAISRRVPSTDAEARDLMELCEDAVRLGSVPIADACESLAYSRAICHKSAGELKRETSWLLRGIDAQMLWLPPDRGRELGYASRRRFDSLCERSANALISALAIGAVVDLSGKGLSREQEDAMKSALRAAENVLEGVMGDEVMAQALKGHVEANLLECAFDTALAQVKGDTTGAAAGVVRCLEERHLSSAEGYGGAVSTLADPRAYSELLDIAFAILAREDEESKGRPVEFATCAFTLHGMHILMARLTQVLSWEVIVCSPLDSPSLTTGRPSAARKEYFGAMRLAFCRGLMRILSNRQSAAVKAGEKKERTEVSLEDEIELMLSPCV